jgi:cyanophycin synthetase
MILESDSVTIRRFDGPNLSAPFAAIVAEFTSRVEAPLPAAEIGPRFDGLLPPELRPALKLPDGTMSYAALAGHIANAWQDIHGENHLPVEVHALGQDRWRIALGFLDADVATSSLKAGLEFAAAIFAPRKTAAELGRLRDIASRLFRLVGMNQPRRVNRFVIRQAASRGIPVHSHAPGSQIWVHGLGARSHRFLESITLEQPEIGSSLCGNKVHSKRFLARLGFPVSPYGMADNLLLAREIAERIGFPVVTKPPDREKSIGVTTDIKNVAELASAFDFAKRESGSGQVLIERHIAGENFRLTIFGGRLKRNAHHMPATVIGDGTSHIAELIAAENERRTPAEFASGEVRVKLTIDSAMLGILAKQGFALDDRPPSGRKIVLQRTSNLGIGGRHRDVTAETHPDTIAMAEAVARCFGLKTAGIDFISPDITKSWRDIECAINEVNSPPGISDDGLAEGAYRDKFPEGANGLIPCVLVVSDRDDIGLAVAEAFKARGMRAGFAGHATTSLDGGQRFTDVEPLPERISSVLFDPGCDALVVACSNADIEAHGLPYAKFNVAVIAEESIDPAIRALVASHVAHCVDGSAKIDAAELCGRAIAAAEKV